MLRAVLEESLRDAGKEIEKFRDDGWRCKVVTDIFPLEIIFTKDEITLWGEQREAEITFTFAAETNTGAVWGKVKENELKKLRSAAEKYANLYYKYFFAVSKESEGEEE